MATAGEKFFKSLKLREWGMIETKTGMGMVELTEGNAPAAVLTACLVTVAKRRLGAGFSFEDAEEMDLEEAGKALTEAVEALGFEDDPADTNLEKDAA